MNKAIFLLVLGAVALSAGALAADHTIRQKGRMFSQPELSIRTGETVVFANDDSVPHNIVSSSSGNEFDLGSQAPGTSTPVTFTAAGEVQVLCVIHPRMRMTIKVAD